MPEFFTAPVLQKVLDERRAEDRAAVPYFEGFLTGEPPALVESFAGEPLLYDPRRGRVQGVRAFMDFYTRMSDWLLARNVTIEHVDRVSGRSGGFEEVVLHVDAATRRVALPTIVVAEQRADGRIDELRVYHSNRPLAGRHGIRPPLLQLDPKVSVPDSVAPYQHALTVGDVDAAVAAFEPDGYVREAEGAAVVHRGAEALRAFHSRLFAHGGGIEQELCRVASDGRRCAVEYNVMRWGTRELLPQAGLTVHVLGESGRLAAVRVYDDVEPPPLSAS
jgi:hypothetical protein